MQRFIFLCILLFSLPALALDSTTLVQGTAHKINYQIQTFTTWPTQKDYLNFNLFSYNALTKKESLSLIVEPLKKPATLEEYTQANLDSMKSLMKGFKKIKSSELKNFKYPHQLIEYKHQVGGSPKQAFLLIMRLDRYGLAITCTAPPGTFDDFRQDFIDLMSSFQMQLQ